MDPFPTINVEDVVHPDEKHSMYKVAVLVLFVVHQVPLHLL